MKKTVATYRVGKKVIRRQVNYIPFRYILAVLLTIFEVATIIGVVVACCYYIPYFYLAALLTQIVCVVRIIASDDNPEYKVPWLFFVLVLPIVGFMLYFLFYSRKLKPRYVRRLRELRDSTRPEQDPTVTDALEREQPTVAADARMLCRISGSRVYTGTAQTYFPSGEAMWPQLLRDLQSAERFILLEYFIVEEGRFWDSILSILKQKSDNGVEIRMLYDDIGCMSTLPGNYAKRLQKLGIHASPFSRLRGNADSEFNNRNHRKILVIDGKVGYTGGINLADEYVNEIVRFGYWKDAALRLEGEAVQELTRLFLIDYGLNVKEFDPTANDYFPTYTAGSKEGYLIPFGDGPRPLYERRVGKSVIQNLLAHANRYVWIYTPYLIIDNDLCVSIENAALRGVDVRIMLPHIPDKKVVFAMSRSFYPRLMAAGVKIYEYAPGFLHAKCYLADDCYGMIGSINLDYRSLVHHLENGVWMYRCECLSALKADMEESFCEDFRVKACSLRIGWPQRIFRAVIRIFAPLL
ncbi:MAG: cardiolipin synthase [Ruminococcaceae bacterium]|nr:cardiolipin synthase [Oscillospiraceae bacterium]